MFFTQLLLGTFGYSQIFGETDAFAGRCNSFSVKTATPYTSYFVISSEAFHKHMNCTSYKQFVKYCKKKDTKLTNLLA